MDNKETNTMFVDTIVMFSNISIDTTTEDDNHFATIQFEKIEFQIQNDQIKGSMKDIRIEPESKVQRNILDIYKGQSDRKINNFSLVDSDTDLKPVQFSITKKLDQKQWNIKIENLKFNAISLYIKELKTFFDNMDKELQEQHRQIVKLMIEDKKILDEIKYGQYEEYEKLILDQNIIEIVFENLKVIVPRKANDEDHILIIAERAQMVKRVEIMKVNVPQEFNQQFRNYEIKDDLILFDEYNDIQQIKQVLSNVIDLQLFGVVCSSYIVKEQEKQKNRERAYEQKKDEKSYFRYLAKCKEDIKRKHKIILESDKISVKYRCDANPIEFQQDFNNWKALDFLDININNLNSTLNFISIDKNKDLFKENIEEQSKIFKFEPSNYDHINLNFNVGSTKLSAQRFQSQFIIPNNLNESQRFQSIDNLNMPSPKDNENLLQQLNRLNRSDSRKFDFKDDEDMQDEQIMDYKVKKTLNQIQNEYFIVDQLKNGVNQKRPQIQISQLTQQDNHNFVFYDQDEEKSEFLLYFD